MTDGWTPRLVFVTTKTHLVTEQSPKCSINRSTPKECYKRLLNKRASYRSLLIKKKDEKLKTTAELILNPNSVDVRNPRLPTPQNVS